MDGRRSKIRRGDRIAQMVIASVVAADLALVDELRCSVRGECGFGSTGVRQNRALCNCRDPASTIAIETEDRKPWTKFQPLSKR
ncbi:MULTISPECIES: hypothetical protein [unclassified Bradyrhizobium]